MDIAELGLSVDTKPVVKADKDLKRLGDTSEKTERKTSGAMMAMDNSMRSLLVPLAGIVSGFATIDKIISTQRSFDVLNAGLITATGSASAAAREFERLQKFAAQTPYSLEQSVRAFTQLKNLGLDPSEASMRAYANTAAAMGYDLSQMVEAVADASVGEFERLRAFGIRASTQGDQIAFTFQGVTTTVKNSAADIEQYLANLGRTNFAGAVNQRMATLDGAISNLGDSWDALILKMSRGGIGDGLASGINSISDFISEGENAEAILDSLAIAGGSVAAIYGGRLSGAIAKKAAAQAKEATGAIRLNTLHREAIAMDAEMIQASVAREAQEARSAQQRSVRALHEQKQRLNAIRDVQAQLVAERNLEMQSHAAQISDKGRIQSMTRLAEINTAEIAIKKQVRSAEDALAIARTNSKTAADAAAAANGRLSVANTAVTDTAIRSTAAARASTVAHTALAAAGRAASGALMLVGGPVGAAVLAVGALAMLAPHIKTNNDRLEDLQDIADKGSKALDKLTESTRQLSVESQKAAIADLTKALEEQKLAAETAREVLEALRIEQSKNAVTGSGSRLDDARSTIIGDINKEIAGVESISDSIDKNIAEYEEQVRLFENRLNYARAQQVRDKAAETDAAVAANNRYWKSVNEIMRLEGADLAKKRELIAAADERRVKAIEEAAKAERKAAAETRYKISAFDEMLGQYDQMQQIQNEYVRTLRDIASAEMTELQRKQLLLRADQERVKALQDLKQEQAAILAQRIQGGNDTGAVNSDFINRTGDSAPDLKSSELFERAARRISDSIDAGGLDPKLMAKEMQHLQNMVNTYSASRDGFDIAGMQGALDNLADKALDAFGDPNTRPMTADEYEAVFKAQQDKAKALEAKQLAAYDAMVAIDQRMMQEASKAPKDLGTVTLNVKNGGSTSTATITGDQANVSTIADILSRAASGV